MPEAAKLLSAALGAAVMLGAAAHGQTVISTAPQAVTVTAYRDPGSDYGDSYWEDWDENALDEDDGLALITETRIIDLPAGRSKISFKSVAEGILAQTAVIEGLEAATVERNQDYDLLTPGALIAKSLGLHVRLARINPASGETTERDAILRSGPGGVVLDFGEGRIEALGCGGWPERLIFDQIPEGLADRPTLSVIAQASEAGRHEVTLSYLAFGVKWAADYVLRIHPDGERLDLSGWITLSNRGATSFTDAPTQVVAGELQRDWSTRPDPARPQGRSTKCWPMDTTTRVRFAQRLPPVPSPPYAPGAMPVEALIVTAQKRQEDLMDVPVAIRAGESDLADYKLYTLPEPTTVAAHQTKQVMMLDLRGVRFERLYVGDLQWDDSSDEEGPRSTLAVLRMKNERAEGLGRALPGGTVTVIEPDSSGGEILAGRTWIRDSPIGLLVEMGVSRSDAVRAHLRLVRDWPVKRGGEDWTRRVYEVDLANDRPTAETVELWLPQQSDAKLVSASKRHGRHYGAYAWAFRLKPGERKTFRYTVETDW